MQVRINQYPADATDIHTSTAALINYIHEVDQTLQFEKVISNGSDQHYHIVVRKADGSAEIFGVCDAFVKPANDPAAYKIDHIQEKVTAIQEMTAGTRETDTLEYAIANAAPRYIVFEDTLYRLFPGSYDVKNDSFIYYRPFHCVQESSRSMSARDLAFLAFTTNNPLANTTLKVEQVSIADAITILRQNARKKIRDHALKDSTFEQRYLRIKAIITSPARYRELIDEECLHGWSLIYCIEVDRRLDLGLLKAETDLYGSYILTLGHKGMPTTHVMVDKPEYYSN